jgi:hypothetical protein
MEATRDGIYSDAENDGVGAISATRTKTETG